MKRYKEELTMKRVMTLCLTALLLIGTLAPAASAAENAATPPP